MRIMYLTIVSLFLLTGCQADTDTAFNQQLKATYPDIHVVESIVTDDVIYVAMIIKPLKQFSEQKIAADIKKDLSKKYPDHLVYTSSDMKATIEVRKQSSPLTKERLNQLISYDQSIEKDD